MGSAPADNSHYFSITADATGYNLYNAYGTVWENRYMYAENGAVKVGYNISDVSKRTWELEDVFSIQAEFTDNAEFVFYNLATDKCLQYNNVYSENMSLSVADYNPVIDETVAASGYYGGYIARALSVCQRFKFEPVYDAGGNLLYFYILPYLKINANDIKGAYRSDYRLAVDENGNLYVRNVDDGEDATNTCFTFEGDADSCQWQIASDDTAQLGLAADIDGNYIVKMGASYTSWHVKTICLNVGKRYQEKKNTCGASTTLMLLDYLRPDHGLTEQNFVDIMRARHPTVYNPVSDLGRNKNYINPQYELTYVYDYDYFNMDELYKHIVNSLDQGFPVTIQIKSVTQNDKVILGYTGSNHYLVVKGIVYNPLTCTYDVIANDCHYKFGPDDNYSGEVYNNIGGRDLVLSWNVLFTLYEQSEEAMIFVI